MYATTQNIDKYLSSDVIFDKINSMFMRMDNKTIKDQNKLLGEFFYEFLIDAMKEQSFLFTKTYKRIIWVGSYYKGTRFGRPEEYDVNFVIDLPFKKEDIKFETDRPGFIKIRINPEVLKSQKISNLGPQAYRELMSFIDKEYLNQEKFRAWIEGILSKVANIYGKNDKITFRGYVITKKKSGPAFTLKLNYKKNIDIDVVPVLVFPVSCLPPKYSRKNLSKFQYRYWSVVPKPLNNRSFHLSHRYWRLCFYEFEKDMLSSYDYGRMKPVIRQLKKFRDTQGWKSIASYYIETLCYHQSEMFHISQRKSHTFFFFKMLEKLYDAFDNHCIKYYWDNDLNLLKNIKPEEIKNMKGRLQNILKIIRNTIARDQYAIAKWILNKNELEILQTLVHQTISENETSDCIITSEPKEQNQWYCMIS